MSYDLNIPESVECFQRQVEEVESAVMTMRDLIKDLPEKIGNIEDRLDIDYAIHQQPLYTVAYMLDHLHDDLSELFESILKAKPAKKPTPVHMPPKATLCGSDLAGKMAILEMSLGYMLNMHKDFHPAHSEYLGAFELCCEIRKQLDGGAV